MSVYLDASVLVSLFTTDPHTRRAERFLRAAPQLPVVGDFAAAEFASAIARRVRTRELRRGDAQTAFSNFDLWTRRAVTRIETTASDIAAAEVYLRRLDLTLRTPDALNIATAQRIGAGLATFDTKMAAAARALGLAIAGV